MDWNDVRHFLALARLGSVRAAGAALGMSHSTVARRIEALEARLGVRLFDRSRDGYALTDAGRQMLPGAERIEHEMAALERGLVGQDERLAGPVSLTCSDRYISGILVASLAAFCARYPDIEVSITIDSRPLDLARREADIAIRALSVDAQPPGYLIGQRLVPVTLASYVARAHAARLDPARTDAGPTRWLSFDQRRLHQELVGGSSYPALPLWGSFSSIELLMQATLAGLGLAMLPTYAGDQEAGLQRLAQPDLRHMGDFWLLCHPDLRDNARLRAARSHIAQVLRDHMGLFQGQHAGWSADATGCPAGAPHDLGGERVH